MVRNFLHQLCSNFYMVESMTMMTIDYSNRNENDIYRTTS